MLRAATSKTTALFVTIVFLLTTVLPAGANDRFGGGSNGQHTKPFYIVAHNPNQTSEAENALYAGANALEPDVMVFDDGATGGGHNINGSLPAVYVNDDGVAAVPSRLFMYHDDVRGFPWFDNATRLPTSVEQYFKDLHTFLKNNGGNCNRFIPHVTCLALITFDIKTPAASADNVAKLRNAAHIFLNYDGVNVNLIFSVATITDSAAFTTVAPILDANEGLMIDSENDPVAVLNHLRNMGAARVAYGNGTFGLTLFQPAICPFGDGRGVYDCGGPHVMLGTDEAAWIRASQVWDRNQYINGGPGFGVAVPYAYPVPVGTPPNIGVFAYEFMNDGIDGLIADADEQPQNFNDTLAAIRNLRACIDNSIAPCDQDHFMATDVDNPFFAPPEAYALRVETRSSFTEFDDLLNLTGTGDGITFKLTGECGSAQTTVSGNFFGHFGRDSVAYVVLPSKNLGKLQSIQLFSNGGDDWGPGHIEISSARWGIPYSSHFSADFSGSEVDNDDDSPSSPLPGWGYTCDVTPPHVNSVFQSPAPAAAGGWVNQDVTVFWDWADNAGGSGVRNVACDFARFWTSEGELQADSFCVDVDGNRASNGYIVRLDKTAPVFQCGGPDGQWHAHDISIACSASDPFPPYVFKVSGLANPNDANFLLSTNVPDKTETANAFTNGYDVADAAGNHTNIPAIGGNQIDKKPPVITITQPAATNYTHADTLVLNYTVTDGGSGVNSVSPTMNGSSTVGGSPLPSGRAIPLLTLLPLGANTFKIDSTDRVFNPSSQSVTFTIIVTAQSIIQDVAQLQGNGLNQPGDSLVAKLSAAAVSVGGGDCVTARNQYSAFIHEVQAQTGKSISPTAAGILIGDAQYMIGHCQ